MPACLPACLPACVCATQVCVPRKCVCHASVCATRVVRMCPCVAQLVFVHVRTGWAALAERCVAVMRQRHGGVPMIQALADALAGALFDCRARWAPLLLHGPVDGVTASDGAALLDDALAELGMGGDGLFGDWVAAHPQPEVVEQRAPALRSAAQAARMLAHRVRQANAGCVRVHLLLLFACARACACCCCLRVNPCAHACRPSAATAARLAAARRRARCCSAGARQPSAAAAATAACCACCACHARRARCAVCAFCGCRACFTRFS